MLDPSRSPEYRDLLDAALNLIARSDAATATDEFGINELLNGGSLEREEEMAVYAFLEAQGYHASTSSVLSRFALVDVIGEASSDEGLVGHLYGQQDGDLKYVAVAGWRSGDRVVVDDPKRGLRELRFQQVAAPSECAYVATLEATGDDGVVHVLPDRMETLRPRITRRLMLGAAAEMLGACTRLLDNAVEHTKTREQFGGRLADFPPVQAMLAWSAAERHQLRTLLDLTIGQSGSDPRAQLAATVTKGLAGRAARVVAQQTLQATGGIGFTWEYTHHRLHRRLLALDTVGGLSADIAGELGRLVRTTGELPDFVSL